MPDAHATPPYYKPGGIEAIDVIEAYGLGFNLGNAIKYLLRAGRKDSKGDDLRKAIAYIHREMTGQWPGGGDDA